MHNELTNAVARICAVGIVGLLVSSCSPKAQEPESKSQFELSTSVTYAEDIVNDQHASASTFEDNAMTSQLTEARLSEITKALHATYGDVVSKSSPTLKVIQGYDVVYVPYTFQRGSQDVKIVFDGMRKVSGLYFVKHGEL